MRRPGQRVSVMFTRYGFIFLDPKESHEPLEETAEAMEPQEGEEGQEPEGERGRGETDRAPRTEGGEDAPPQSNRGERRGLPTPEVHPDGHGGDG